jgi:type IV secretory pathway VirJ component
MSRHFRLRCGCLALLAIVLALPAWSQEIFSHGRFADVRLVRPPSQVKSVALLLSGQDGWTAPVTQLARQLASQGALVVGVDTARFFGELEKDDASCVFPAGDLENLSHYVQGYAKLATYHTPMLVGYGSGATFAYAMIAQAPAGTFAGAVSLAFCPSLALHKPLCKGEGLATSPRKGSAHVAQLMPSPIHGAPWVVLQGSEDRACPAATTQPFVRHAKDAELTLLSGVTSDYATSSDRWLPQLSSAYERAATHHATVLPLPPPSLVDLPLVKVAAKGPPTRTFAVLLSGDGGWAGIDRSVASALAARGVSVVGFDSLRYFWSKRTPKGLATDLDRLIRYYLSRWQKDKVLLIGYSQGADVLPFAVRRLPAETASKISRTALIAPGTRASFEFHLGNWLRGDDEGLPILPETGGFEATKTLCLYGRDEDDSLCPQIPAGRVDAQVLPGGHHFDGDYGALAQRILAGLPLS